MKKYIEEQYKLAISDFKIAKTEDEQWQARKDMARIEALATEKYGFEYCDELQKLKSEIVGA